VTGLHERVIGEDDLREYLHATEIKQQVVPASAFVAEVAERLWGADKPEWIVLPWSKTHQQFAFRPGEVTLWAGINGHGKSMMLSQTVLSLCSQGQRCCVASFEMDPWRQMERMMRQSAGGDQPTQEWLELFGQWTDGKLWFYDQQGTVKAPMIFALVRYCAEKLKVGHIVIDSLMKCMRAEDDMNAQKEFVDELCALARSLEVHVHLVHHVRKGDDERSTKMINKFDVKGSGSITDQVDNVLLVWRNKAKENEPDKRENEPDAMLIVDKQRNGEWEGKVALWFHKGAMQYLPDGQGRVMDLLRLG
jgi:twinkle protein